ncbi:MAG: glutathione peroxidase [Phycisphaerae bacterium]|nr:glutathione peroxidase [Phycisphaerae bacterium]
MLTGFAGPQDAPKSPDLTAKWKDKSFFALKCSALDGKPIDLSAYAGKVVLVVNVASKCGYTPQYTGLEAMWKKYKDQGLVVIGFPSNDFGGQEPGSPGEIQEFCSKNYGVTFPIMAKVQTKAGEGQSEMYEFLGARTGSLPGWNFGKYLIGRDGAPVAFYASKVTPEGEELTAAVEAQLKKSAPAASAAPPASPAK